jgi:glycosyltransferase involved in cell wall biosynthesis
MRIGLLRSVDSEGTGLDTYARCLESGLKGVDAGNSYVEIGYDGLWYSIRAGDSITRHRYTRIPVLNTLSNHLRLPRILRKLDLDILHGLCDFIPLGGGGYKRVFTVHDLTGLLFPETHKLAVALNHRLIMPLELKTSDAVIAVSENTKHDLIKHFNVDEGRIHVVYEGVDSTFRSCDTSEVKSKYGLDFPFILYVGTLEPRKNIPRLLNAFKKLVDSGISHRLVVAGRSGWKYAGILESVGKLGLTGRVVFTGYVPREDLPGLYSLADVFVFPSLYEGFGLPVLEAMACGTPVVCSNTSSLPEVAGDAALTVDPLDVEGLAESMERVLTDGGLADKLRKRGLKQAAGFTWEYAAGKTLKVYEGLG